MPVTVFAAGFCLGNPTLRMISLHSGLGVAPGGEVGMATAAQSPWGKPFQAGVKSEHVGVRHLRVSAITLLTEWPWARYLASQSL